MADISRVTTPDLLACAEAITSGVNSSPLPLLATKDQVNAVTTAVSARIGYHMDGDGCLAVTSSPEFSQVSRDYPERLKGRDTAARTSFDA